MQRRCNTLSEKSKSCACRCLSAFLHKCCFCQLFGFKLSERVSDTKHWQIHAGLLVLWPVCWLGTSNTDRKKVERWKVFTLFCFTFVFCDVKEIFGVLHGTKRIQNVGVSANSRFKHIFKIFKTCTCIYVHKKSQRHKKQGRGFGIQVKPSQLPQSLITAETNKYRAEGRHLVTSAKLVLPCSPCSISFHFIDLHVTLGSWLKMCWAHIPFPGGEN